MKQNGMLKEQELGSLSMMVRLTTGVVLVFLGYLSYGALMGIISVVRRTRQRSVYLILRLLRHATLPKL
jgi:hypothetical protein